MCVDFRLGSARVRGRRKARAAVGGGPERSFQVSYFGAEVRLTSGAPLATDPRNGIPEPAALEHISKVAAHPRFARERLASTPVSRRHKILFLTPNLQQGGAERQLLELIRRLPE